MALPLFTIYLFYISLVLNTVYSKALTVLKDINPEYTCGKINTFTTIVNGQETTINRYPWMATLRENGKYICGASLINDRYVITTASCLQKFKPSDTSSLTVRLNEYNLTDTSAIFIERKVSSFESHKEYDKHNFINDISLIRLSEPIILSKSMQPICLPDDEKDFAEETGIATGWGAVCEGCNISETLQEINVSILSLEKCRKSKHPSDLLTNNMLCVVESQEGRHFCNGDGGSPLHIIKPDSAEYQLAGIVSWGTGCTSLQYPEVYTRVNGYLNWIKERTRDACKCE